MAIKSRVEMDVHGNITVRMEGGLDYEIGPSLKIELERLTNQYPKVFITLDMTCIDFVGSSGIGDFVEVIRNINQLNANRLKLRNVCSEFKRVFKLYSFQFQDWMEDYQEEIQIEQIEMLDDDSTETLAPYGKKRTFAN